MPSRYQSDRVDCASGPLRRRGHRRLRAVLRQTADNLVHGNHYFAAQAAAWQRAGKDPRWIRVKVAKHFRRLAYALVAGGPLFPQPCCQQRHAILAKLLEFHSDHGTPLAEVRQDLDTVFAQLSPQTQTQEVPPLRARLDDLVNRRRGPPLLQELIPVVLALRVQLSRIEAR